MSRKITLLLAAFLLSSTIAVAETYKLYGDARVGSKFRSVEATSAIPFDKTYAELTQEQKDMFRATYGGLRDDEQPPYPSAGSEAIYKPIIEGHNRIARGGNLFLVAMVNEQGKVENVAVYESPADAMTELATAVLFNTEFDPASCAGAPCKMEFPFEFELSRKEKIRN